MLERYLNQRLPIVNFQLVRNSINITCRLMIGLVFVFSAAGKVEYPLSFAYILGDYSIPHWLTDTFVTILPSIEMLIGVFLLLGLMIRATSLAATVLLAFYTGVLVYSLATGNTNHGCGCFLTNKSSNEFMQFISGGHTITASDVLRDTLFVGLSLAIYFSYVPRLSFDGIWLNFYEKEEAIRRELQHTKVKNTRTKKVAQTAKYPTVIDWINLRFYFLSGVLGILIFCAILSPVTLFNLREQKDHPLAHTVDFHPRTSTLEVGQIAPDFSLATLDGQHYNLKEYRGRVVLLEFFALWCPHCQAQAPIIHKINTLFSHTHFQTLSVIASPYSRDFEQSDGVDKSPYTSKDVSWFEQTYHTTNPVLIDPTFTVSNKYLGNGYPALYIIGKTGIIRAVFTGTTSEKRLIQAIRTANA